MRNPSRKPQPPSWREIVGTIYRGIRRGSEAAGGARKARARWIAGGLLCVALAVGISLAALARERSAKKEAVPAAGSNAAWRAVSAAAKITKRNEAPNAETTRAAAKEPGEEKAGAGRNAKGEAASAESQEAAAQDAGAAAKTEWEKEGPDLVRARAAWFYDQRAYPLQHIPEGALQKAIQQRDAMKARQRAAATPQLNANGIISFPGDALWHLMGPQPVDEPFSVNTGFPTASGRVTAIAPDPTDATGQTVYIGGAAGGVWKTTDGGAHWTPLTDFQPSLAVGSIAIDPNNHNIIYVGTGEESFGGDNFYGTGILKSTDGGNTWTQTGGPFAGALTSTFGGAKIGAIAVQPGNSNVVLAAAYFFDGNDPRGGIYQSLNGGATWSLPAAGAQGSAGTAVVFESTNVASNTGATVWAALGDIFSGASSNGVWKSTDSGAHWTKQTGTGANVLPTTNVGRITLGYAPSTAGGTATIYAAIADSSGSSVGLLGLFKTIDGGANWTTLTGPAGGFCNSQCFYDMAVGVHPTNPNVVVLGGGAGPDNFTSLFESQNGGATWTPAGTLGNPPPAGDFSNGSTSTHPHVDTHAIVFSATGSLLFVGNDGGVWSTNTPIPASSVSPTWSDLNAGLAITQFYPGPSAGVSDENYGFGGTQDNDTEIFTGTLDWTNVSACGDGGFTAIDPHVPTTVYTTCDRLATLVKKSVFNGAVLNGPDPNFGAPFVGPNPTFNPAASGITVEKMEFIPPLTIDGSNPNTLYFGTCHLYQTNDGAATWTAITGDLPSGTNTLGAACGGAGDITTMDVAHQSSGIVLVGTSNGKVWRTLTATSGIGSSWTEIDNLVPGQLPGRHITAVRTQRNDSTGNVAYVTFSGFGSCAGCDGKGHIFATTDGGTTWTDISGDLPDTPVNDLIVDHNGGNGSNPPFDALYIGTDVGVFSCPSPALTLCAEWTVVGDGLPNSPVLGLAQRRPSRILRAATHGRSMWQIQLTDENPGPVAFLSSVTPAAAKVGDPTTQVTITGGNFSTNTQVLFDGVSVGTPTFVSTTQLTVSVNSSLLTDGHVFQVSLTDPQGADPGSGPFAVMNPVLNANNMTPNNTTTYTPVTLQFSGGGAPNFVPGTLVTFNGVPLSGGTVTGGGTGFSVQVPASLLTVAMPVTVTITNSLPGGGPTPPTSFAFTINPNPNALAIFTPSPIVLGPVALGGSTSLTTLQLSNPGGMTLSVTAESITGTNKSDFGFVAPTLGAGQVSCNFENTGIISLTSGSSCFFGVSFTADTPTGNVNPRTATLNVTDNGVGNPQAVSILGILNTATVAVTPVNFGPVGIGTTSPTMNATLINFSGATLNVDATGFTIGGANKADFQFVSAAPSGNPGCPSLASFSIPSNTLCDVGLVFTPSVAGNESATISVSDNGPGSPQSAPLLGVGIELTSILPPIVATGGPAFTLTVNGGGFVPSAVVNVDGSARLTTFISSNELLASIPASDIATAGTLAITVTSPNPGGTTSEPKTLFIAQAPPASNDNINFALGHRAGATTFRTASGPFTGGGNPVTLTWSAPFANTSYTAICTTEVIPGIFSLPTITARAATTITVVPAPGGTPSGVIACMAIPDSDTSTVRKARVPFSSAANVTVTWNPAFGGNAYVTACTVESASAATFTSVISTFTATSIVVDNSAYASGTMHCIGIPKDGTYTSNVRSLKTPISGSPQGVAVAFGAPFNLFTNDNTDYVAACSDVEPGVTSATAALAILAGSKNVNGFTVINEIPSGTLHCIAVPLGGSANSRFTEDTTQATAQLAAITSPATLATPVDPTPACAPSGAAQQGRAKSVWEVYIAAENGTVVADTRFSSYPTILSAWTISTALPSSTETFTPLACASGNVPASGSSPVQSSVRFNVTQGTTYFFMVSDATSTGAGGILTFNIDAGDVAPPNDDNATPISVTPAQLPYNNTVNSVLATPNTNTHNDPTPPCAPGGAASGGMANSVWYTFTPSTSGRITADTLTSPYETILNVTSGTPTGTQVACNQSAAAGIAQSQVSFAAVSGTQYFFMISSVLGDGGTTNFHLNFSASVVGTPASITATSGTPQSAAINTAFAAPLVATVKDSGGNGVSGVTVTFNPPASGASGTFAGGVNTATTNASGVATSATFTANATAGSYTVTATVVGVVAPANFSLTNTAGTPASVTATSGTPQSATINTAFAAPLVATVKDSGGNPVSGATVTFNAPPSGASGTFGGGVKTGTTNASGVATSATFTANSTAGSYTVTATVAGVASPANFSLTNNAGSAASITSTGGTPQSATISTAFAAPLVATVKDSGGNPVSGVTVTFNAPASGASGTFAGGVNTATTNASGVATSATFTANATAGSYTVTATVAGVASPANFSLTNTTGSTASITATSGTPQSATINAAFAAPLVAAVKDSGGNPVSGVTVTFNAPASGASGTFAGGVKTATTNASGVATSATFTANSTAGSYTVTATVAGVASPANFSLTNNPGPAASITATSGTPQSATIGTAFSAPLAATVKDSGGNPLSGVTVTFSAPASGASGTFAGGVKTATTNASGVATSATFTANSTAGSYTVTATVVGVAAPANFSLTNNPGPAASITATSGTPQSAPISTAFAAPLVATVKDSGGNPVSGMTVTFTAPSSGASGTFAGGVNTATTNASGVATSATFTANGTAGAYTVTATVSGVATPANFSLSNTAGTPASITATSGTPQNATVNTAFAAALVATVKDAGNNPVSGVTVTFNAPASGASGTFAGGVKTATTNASGMATSATFTANSTAGSYTVTATVAGVAAPANFSLTNNPGAAASITATSGTPQSTAVSTAFAAPLVATVKDSGGNGVSGVTVTFTAPASGASGTFAGGVNTATTNASGVATSAAFTANATAGAYTVTATVSGVAAPANFSLTNTAGAPASITATAGTPQGAAINTAFATQFQATVKDAGGNGVSGVTVTFTAPSSGASGTFAGGVNTATTNASGIATAAVFTANSTVGSYTVTATVSGVAAPANFSLTNNAGPAATITATSGTPQSATIGTAFAAPLVATVKDAGSNPVAGVVVTFTAPSSGASGTFAGGANTATTNASGVATSAVFTANSTAGAYTVTAKVSGVATGANFSLTNTAGSAVAIVVTSGGSQSAAINTAFASLTATVKDSGGNGVPGVTVTFTAPSSGASGTFAGGVNTAVTDTTGLATAPTFTANSVTGNYTVRATASGVAAPANFSLTNTAGPAASITATSGTPQSATINAAFASPLVATVKDSGGNPVSGVTVTFTAPSSGASGTFAGGVKTATTNASGVATSAVFTANATAGSYTVTATVAGVAAPANFSLTNNPGPAASIAATSGTPQSTTINSTFAAPLVATVKDSGGNAVSGVTVTFTAPSSGASGGFTGGVNTATTDSSGVATSATFTANATAGAYTVTASVSGVATSANFSLTNLSGSPASIAATAGTPQSAPINTAFTTQLQATVKDSGGNPVSGAVVTFTAPSSGASGTFAGGVNTATTNASGVATAAIFTANGTVGAYTVTASVAGVAAPANFSLSNTAGPPASITATSGTPQSATINTAFAAPLVATVKDSGGNPVSGITVTFTAPSTGASGSFAGGANTATTNASGVATSVVFTANATAGSYAVTAAVSGVATPANFSLTNKPGPPASISATAGTPQTATISSAFATQLQATVKDAGSNPVSGVVVTFAAPASGASGAFAGAVNTATTNASGVATATVFTANSTAGAYTVTASVAGVATPANFSLTNNNPMPAITPPLSPASVTAGSAAFTLTITGTNFVAGATVAFGSNPALTPTSITSTQIVVTVPAADFSTGGTPNVTVVNPGPGGGASNAVAFTVNNPVPTVTSASAAAKNHVPGGAAFTLTVNGTNFVSTSVINFIVGAGTPKAEPTTFVSATQLTAAIPAGDVSSAGTASITVTNPNPGGGTTAANTTFTVDGYAVAGPATPPSVKAGQPASIQITVTPTANGFTNAVTFSVSGLPAHSTAAFNPPSVTPNGTATSTTLTVTTVAGGAMPPAAPVDPPTAPLMRLLPLLWLATLLAAVYAARLARRAPHLRRYVALLPLTLLLITGAALAGCIGGKSGTPKGPAQLTITATSGTMSQTTNVTLTVN